jgi:hypothetical protein
MDGNLFDCMMLVWEEMHQAHLSATTSVGAVAALGTHQK